MEIGGVCEEILNLGVISETGETRLWNWRFSQLTLKKNLNGRSDIRSPESIGKRSAIRLASLADAFMTDRA
jgi:hypothetical protein